jgi:Leucine-rich repeat (LRR) protein
VLNLDGNRLTLLPAEIAGMTALRELWVHDNQLAVIPGTRTPEIPS